MHCAPSVSFPVGQWSLAPCHGLLLTLAGLVLGLNGLLYGAHSGIGLASGLLAWMACLGAALWSRRVAVAGTLSWRGDRWVWATSRASHDGMLRIQVDLQRCMVVVLRLQDGRSHWFLLRRDADPLLWHPLRCALVSSARQRAGRLTKPSDDGAPQ